MNGEKTEQQKGTGRQLFESDRERIQLTIIIAGLGLGGLVMQGRGGSEDELIYDAFKLARKFVQRAETLALHGDIIEDGRDG